MLLSKQIPPKPLLVPFPRVCDAFACCITPFCLPRQGLLRLPRVLVAAPSLVEGGKY
jgi:hypothetical protein